MWKAQFCLAPKSSCVLQPTVHVLHHRWNVNLMDFTPAISLYPVAQLSLKREIAPVDLILSQESFKGREFSQADPRKGYLRDYHVART